MPKTEKKLSAKTIFGDTVALAKRMLKEGIDKKDLYTMIGTASDFSTGTSNFGEWYALLGEFEAVNVDTGEVSNAFKCFLPADITQYFVSALKQANGAVVEFAVMIGIKLTNTTVGYEYTVRPLVQLRQSDAIVKLRAEAAKALSPEIRKALESGTPAPKQLPEGEKKEHKRK